MGWERRRPERTRRCPKVRHLTDAEKKEILRTLEKGVAASPLLSAFGVKVRRSGDRFYIEQRRPGKGSTRVWGRIAPLATAERGLLLEVQRTGRSWVNVARGQADQLVKVIASDTTGTFHLLGSLDASFRRLQEGQERLPVVRDGCGRFAYTDTGGECSVEETLFHYFGLPIEVVAEPSGRYPYHRTLRIIETSKDRTRVLVRFVAQNAVGAICGGACLYMQRNGQWRAYTIKPSEGQSTAQAEAWLAQRKRPAQSTRSTPVSRRARRNDKHVRRRKARQP